MTFISYKITYILHNENIFIEVTYPTNAAPKYFFLVSCIIIFSAAKRLLKSMERSETPSKSCKQMKQKRIHFFSN